MKKIIFMVMLLSSVICGYSQNYSKSQENLRTEISDYLRKEGYNPKNEPDGLMFKMDDDTYYIEIDKESEEPMFICLRRYVKYNDKLTKKKLLRNLNDYNVRFGVKVYCIEKSFVLSSEMYVTKASDFIDVFESLLYQIRSNYRLINK